MIAKRIILALIVAALVAIPITIGRAQQGQNDNGGSMEASRVKAMAKMKVLTGSWVATITAPGMPGFKALITFTDDGGMLVSQATIVPFPPPIGRAVFSAGHGEWDKVKSGEFSFKFVALIHNENAVFLGTSEVNGTIQIDETLDNFSGTARAADLDPSGNVIFGFDASIEGKRIHVEP